MDVEGLEYRENISGTFVVQYSEVSTRHETDNLTRSATGAKVDEGDDDVPHHSRCRGRAAAGARTAPVIAPAHADTARRP